MQSGERPSRLAPRHSTDARTYLDRVGGFLRRRPVEHSVLAEAGVAPVAQDQIGPRIDAGLLFV